MHRGEVHALHAAACDGADGEEGGLGLGNPSSAPVAANAVGSCVRQVTSKVSAISSMTKLETMIDM